MMNPTEITIAGQRFAKTSTVIGLTEEEKRNHAGVFFLLPGQRHLN
jgi:hypothetical protein